MRHTKNKGVFEVDEESLLTLTDKKPEEILTTPQKDKMISKVIQEHNIYKLNRKRSEVSIRKEIRDWSMSVSKRDAMAAAKTERFRLPIVPSGAVLMKPKD